MKRRQYLVIPIDNICVATIPFPMKPGSYQALLDALQIWKPKLVNQLEEETVETKEPTPQI